MASRKSRSNSNASELNEQKEQDSRRQLKDEIRVELGQEMERVMNEFMQRLSLSQQVMQPNSAQQSSSSSSNIPVDIKPLPNDDNDNVWFNQQIPGPVGANPTPVGRAAPAFQS